MPRRVLYISVFCSLLLFLIQPVSVAQSAASAPLVGSWNFRAKPNSPTATIAVSGLLTFTSDGTVIETDTSEAALGATPAHGIWQPGPVPGHWFVRFSSLRANANGSLRSRRIVTLGITVNSTGDEFSGGFSFEVVDPTGHILTTGTGTIVGQLMPHPALP